MKEPVAVWLVIQEDYVTIGLHHGDSKFLSSIAQDFETSPPAVNMNSLNWTIQNYAKCQKHL